MFARLIPVALAILSARVFAQTPDPVAALTTADLAHGKQLFQGHCGLCHGLDGKGGRGPDLTRPVLRRAPDNQALFGLILNGIPGTDMPGTWQVSFGEMWQIAGFVRSLGKQEQVALRGDAARGRATFTRKGRCGTCHIVAGEGGAVGPDLSDIGARRGAAYLQETILNPAATLADDFAVMEVVTRDGRNVRGVRVNEDPFTIQLRDAGNRFQSFEKSDLSRLERKPRETPMPSYRERLSAAEVDDIVAYLASLKGS